MSLMEQIKSKQVAARKSGDIASAALFTTLLGEAGMIGKNAGNRETTDSEVVAVVKKFIKNIDETVSVLSSKGQDATQFIVEKQLLQQFLPQQLSESELVEIAKQYTAMPLFMKHLKENYEGRFDGKQASAIAKTVYAK